MAKSHLSKTPTGVTQKPTAHRASSSSDLPPRYAGKRLESYMSSVSLLGSDNEFAIADYSNGSESEENTSDDNQGPLARSSIAQKTARSKSLKSHSMNREYTGRFGSKSIKATRHVSAINHINVLSSPENSANDPASPSSQRSEVFLEEDDIASDIAQDIGWNAAIDEESDESEDDDGDDFESDSSLDSNTTFPPHLHDSSPRKARSKVKPPKRLSIPIPKRLNLPAKIAKVSSSGPTTSTSLHDGLDDLYDDYSESSIMSETSTADMKLSKNVSTRRPSIVDHTLDEITVFPRSANLNSHETSDSSNVSDITDGSEYGDDTLLAMLSEDDSSVADHDEDSTELFSYDDEADDDNAIEESEERAILEELQGNEALEVPLKVGYESEDGDLDSEVSFSQDPFFESHTSQTASAIRNITSAPLDDQISGEDDSYLWSYFFTSEDESDGRLSSTSNRPEDENNLTPFRDVRSNSAGEFENLSGDSTDEDDSLPQANLRNKPRPTEILSSSATTSRPPVLGSWVMSSERPYGIIDGLSTRTLSPPPFQNSGSTGPENGLEELDSQLLPGDQNMKRMRSKSFQSEENSESELSELALDDFIYTSELEDKDDLENLESHSTIEDLNYHSINKDIPLSAFRSRLSNPQLFFQSSSHMRKSVSGNPRLAGSRKNSRDIIMTPVKPVSRHSRKRRKRSKKQDVDLNHMDLGWTSFEKGVMLQNENELEDLGATDLIDELIGIGALSPLFGGIA